MTDKWTAKEIALKVSEKLSGVMNLSANDASDEQIYKASVLFVKEILKAKADRFHEKSKGKQVCYLCMEFLMGRSLKNTLFNLGMDKEYATALKTLGAKAENIYEQEPDAGLGNGGLGRLAACFLDGLASQSIPAYGYSILYEFGIFRQKLAGGWQTELPDYWLPGGEVWLEARPDEAIEIKFDGQIMESWDGPYHQISHVNYTPVLAVPHDLMVCGYEGKGVSVLRLWSAKAPGFDMQLFNEGDYLRAMEQNAMAEVISKVLYPADNHIEGKSLRLKQQYFLVSASIADIVKRHLRRHVSLQTLPKHVAIHINDTHPALSIPELMRILLDDCGFSWDAAWDIVNKTIAYTNHTVMREALECWTVDLFRARLPRIYQIIEEIDRRFRAEVWQKTQSVDFVERTAIISGGVIRMANLSIIGGHSVNGVSELHSEILKNSVFSDYYALFPEKFLNVTNGIAHRRWLCQSNEGLCNLLDQTIGTDYRENAAHLEKFSAFANDASVLSKLGEIKKQNKIDLAKTVKGSGIILDPNSIFDVQAKRLHEYKRQHMNALHILSEYLMLKDNPNMAFTPKTYLFAAKAAPSYYLAKEIIRLICNIGKLIDDDPAVRDKIKVAYLEDYCVTLAERLMPAAEISEQISLAGTEASGTGNMKLMINGAITLGTEDGANVEIHQAVGDENILIFGLSTPEVNELKNRYSPMEFYNNNPMLKAALEFIGKSGSPVESQPVYSSLMQVDPYMVLADFDDYVRIQNQASALYSSPDVWNRMSLMNIAKAGIFSSDRAIKDYAKNIWKAIK